MKVENRIVGKDTKYPLKGALTLPDDLSKPVPAVVFVHGSGVSNMDSQIKKVHPFRDMANGLAKLGIASIRYDKRSFVYAKELVKEFGSSFTVYQETIEDAILAGNILKKDPRIDPNKVFIAGLSMGGALAPRIDAMGGDFAGIIIMAGTPMPFEDILKGQQEDFLKTAGGPIKWIAKKQFKAIGKKFNGLYEISDEEAKSRKFIGGTTIYYMKDFGMHPAKEYLLNIDKPVLIIQGEKDVQVKVDRDFKIYQSFLSGRENVTFKLYPNLNHVFMPAFSTDIRKAMKEFAVEREVESYVIEDMGKWIKEARS